MQATGVGRFLGLHWNISPVVDYDTHYHCDSSWIRPLVQSLFLKGYLVYADARLVFSYAMTDQEVDGFVDDLEESVRAIRSGKRN